MEKSKNSINVEGGFLFCGGWNFSKSVSLGPTFIREMRVFPVIFTCMLWGTPWNTGFSYTFYRGNICSVDFSNLTKTIIAVAADGSSRSFLQTSTEAKLTLLGSLKFEVNFMQPTFCIGI